MSAMGKVTVFSMKQNYLWLHQWIRKQCDQLTIRQRKVIVYGLSIVYLICSLWMIVQFFLPQKEESDIVIPKGELMDSPIKTVGGVGSNPYAPYQNSYINIT
jgi:hypothetical protein